jgi:hypothetical protein
MEIVSSGTSSSLMLRKEKTIRIGHPGGRVLRTNLAKVAAVKLSCYRNILSPCVVFDKAGTVLFALFLEFGSLCVMDIH